MNEIFNIPGILENKGNVEWMLKQSLKASTSFQHVSTMLKGGGKRFQHCHSTKSKGCWRKCWSRLLGPLPSTRSVAWFYFVFPFPVIASFSVHEGEARVCWWLCNFPRPSFPSSGLKKGSRLNVLLTREKAIIMVSDHPSFIVFNL